MADEVVNVSSPPGDPFSYQELDQAIQALQDGDDIDYQGASGPIDLNDQGDATGGVYDTYEYKNGKIATVGEVPVAKPSE